MNEDESGARRKKENFALCFVTSSNSDYNKIIRKFYINTSLGL